MALIKCPECGTQVSDKAEKCVHCGYPINSNKQSMMPVEESVSDMKESKKKRNLIITVGIIAVAILIGLIIYFTNVNSDDFYYEIAWGTNFEDTEKQLKSHYPEEDIKISDDEEKAIIVSISDYLGDKGVSAHLFYNFNYGENLNDIYALISSDGDKYTDTELRDRYKSELNKLYGSGKEDTSTISWSNDDCNVKLVYLTKGGFSIDFKSLNY